MPAPGLAALCNAELAVRGFAIAASFEGLGVGWIEFHKLEADEHIRKAISNFVDYIKLIWNGSGNVVYRN